jgi:hypothetical protein
MPNPPIKSGAELDWAMVEKAAKDILKQANDADYVPPESIDTHMSHIKRVCVAMNAITDALKLRHINKHELMRSDECSLFNSSHAHADGYIWINCSCGWKSNPIKSRDSGQVFLAHVNQENTNALIKATKSNKKEPNVSST